MVGDYLYDLQAGRSAGALTVHVDATRSFRWPELADVGVGTLEELIPMDKNLMHLRQLRLESLFNPDDRSTNLTHATTRRRNV
jgi:hypothetical protein